MPVSGRRIKSGGENRNQTCGVFGLALPYDESPPAKAFQLLAGPPVAFDIATEFLLPEFRPSLRHRAVRAAGVPVPEAAVDEHREPVPSKNEIGTAGKLSTMQPKPEPHTVSGPADSQLGHGIARPDTRHHLAAPLAIDNIHQVDCSPN